MSKTPTLEQLHLHFIRTTPEELWSAITDPRTTPLYFHGLAVESDFRPGSGLRYLADGGGAGSQAVIEGEILGAEPGRRLAHTFRFLDGEDPPTEVVWEIEAAGEDVTRLALVHRGFRAETETWTTTRTGWCPILSGLKTLLETGEPLGLPARSAEGVS